MPKHPLVDALRPALRRYIQERVFPDVDPEKYCQLALARRSYLYWDGFQNVYPQVDHGVIYNYLPVPQPGQGQYFEDSQRDVQALYDGNINLVRGDGNKFVAVLSNRAPNVKAMPLQSDSEDLQKRAKLADKILMALRRSWDVDIIQQQMAFNAWTFGTYFPHIYWEVDPQKYGKLSVGKFEEKQLVMQGQQCMRCGMEYPEPRPIMCERCGGVDFQPQEPITIPYMEQVGEESFPIGAPKVALATVADFTVPFYSKDIEDSVWGWYDQDIDSGRLVQAFQDDPKMIEAVEADGGGLPGWATASQTGQTAHITRELMASKVGSPLLKRRSRWNFGQFWITPARYWSIPRSWMVHDIKDAKGVPMPARPLADVLKEAFPRGVRAQFVEGELMGLRGEALSDCWGYGKPGVSPYIYGHPVSYDLIPIADMVNFQHALFSETVQRNIPVTLINNEMIDPAALQSRAGIPGEFIPVRPMIGQKMSEALYNVQMAKIEPQLATWIQGLMATGREITGVLPAIFGAESSSNTAREAELRRNQALMQLSLSWNGMRNAWRGIYTCALRLLQKNGAWALKNFGLTEQEVRQMDTLLSPEGNLAGFYLDIEEAIPATWGQVRDAVNFVLQGGPPMWQLTGAGDPANMTKVHTALGISGWRVPGNDARTYVMEEITGMLAEQPFPGPMGPMPSRPIDGLLFVVDPMLAIQVIKEWLVSDEGRNQREINPGGYMNIMALGLAVNQQVMMQQQAAAMAAGGVPPEGEEAGAGPASPPSEGLPGGAPAGNPLLGQPPAGGVPPAGPDAQARQLSGPVPR